MVKKFDANGEPIRGERTINKEQAAIVKRIFMEYAAGKSPLAIAKKLNEDGVAGPSTKTGWSQSTINGNRKRGTGILNNELYIGEMIWNRQRYVKNPDTGKRVTRLNPENEWIRKDVPEMRIIEQELWDKVKERQAGLSKSRLTDCQRPKMLLTGLIKCGCCGGGYTKISKTHYGCFSAKKKGMCDNHEVIRQDTLEHMILHALQQHLLNPDMCEVSCNEYTRYMNELRMQHNAQKRGFEKELAKRIKDDDRMVQMVLDGISSTEQMKDRINSNLHRIEELKELLKDKEEAPVLLHPNMGSYYKREIGKLVHSLTEGENLHEAADLIRGLIDKIILTPKESGEGLYIDLKGDLAGILAIAVGNKQDTEKHAVIQQMQNIKVELETATDKALETGDSQFSDLLVAGGVSQQVSGQNLEDVSERELTPA
ncbi:MAG: recombinase family protein, partial [Rickettsiales bacterium]|nr:recombinase family protein [Rickettsiales bacterium]